MHYEGSYLSGEYLICNVRLQVHTASEQHESEARYMSTCNCGRSQRIRVDPFDVKV